jgi:hypothetical protein
MLQPCSFGFMWRLGILYMLQPCSFGFMWRLGILYMLQPCSLGFMWILALYSHVVNTRMATSPWQHHLTKSGGFVPLNYFNAATFYWSACTKPGKSVVMYICVWAVDFVPVLIKFKNYSDCVVFFVFHFIFPSTVWPVWPVWLVWPRSMRPCINIEV